MVLRPKDFPWLVNDDWFLVSIKLRKGRKLKVGNFVSLIALNHNLSSGFGIQDFLKL